MPYRSSCCSFHNGVKAILKSYYNLRHQTPNVSLSFLLLPQINLKREKNSMASSQFDLKQHQKFG